MAEQTKGPRRDPNHDDNQVEKRLAKHIQSITYSPSPAAYAMKTYTADFFLAEDDSEFKIALASYLTNKFPNMNPLWQYISVVKDQVLHLL